MALPKGFKMSEQSKKKMSESAKKAGTGKWMLGRHLSDETIKKIVDKHKGKKYKMNGIPAWNKGLKGFNGGEKNGRWIEDRSLIKHQENRNNPEYKQWRMNVWKRDGFKCKMENEDCDGSIIAHHILPWRDYVDLRYYTNNGITLCHAHHPRKRVDEAKLSPFFQKIVAEGN